MPRRHLPPTLFLVLLPIAFAGCGPIVQLGAPSGPPPAQHVLATLPTPATAAPEGLVDPATAVTLLAASAPAMLQTTRIPVQVGPTEVRYIVGHAWTEPPARLFAQLLEEQLASAGVPLIDRRITGRSAGRQLGGELTRFGVDATGAPRVHVRFDATLNGPDGVRRRSFQREAPLARIDGPEAAAALSTAGAEVAAEITRWVIDAGAERPSAGQ